MNDNLRLVYLNQEEKSLLGAGLQLKSDLVIFSKPAPGAPKMFSTVHLNNYCLNNMFTTFIGPLYTVFNATVTLFSY